ncbi:relaxase domain-containing protein (plasmid) [Mycobacterium intracellulare subsp. chimaera]|uniref:MobF family relaxase n=1 Tax=Mycobacterium intracellulare TaxID=1767 RepID=UPI000B3E1155|nr:MobF family relaxase [Mycobacterium intracellulare]ARV85396.1 AAA family ATPase [Mycobacterium intracellulare subsp. chimaera]QGK52123.1 relaxase domain-containing protein [Mycobacterium intracellulare subsp. chimaera]UCN07161.1 relaxase domain-containing protein [Mycobacterium intracellulare subsp. chimaera]
MLTVAKLSLWSVNYYNDTARAVGQAAKDARAANGGLAEYYAERDTRTPVWTCAGDVRVAAALIGLTEGERSGGDADPEVVARWLDDGVAPSGECGRAHGKHGVHGFDLTFCAPKSVSLVRVFGDDVIDKAVSAAHQRAIGEALEYLSAHAGYTRVHNPITGEKDLQKLPGLVAAAYQHETSRAGDPHLHTHVLVPNRQARADGRLVSIDGTSLFHEARAAGIVYQATVRHELQRLTGIEWGPVDPSTGMAEIAGIEPINLAAWSTRSTQLREWAAANLTVVDDVAQLSQAQLAAAQKATRPRKPESLSWAELRAQWRADERGLRVSRAAQQQARTAREQAARAATARVTRTGVAVDRRAVAAMAARADKAALTRADLVEVIGAQLPLIVDAPAGAGVGAGESAGMPRAVIEACVDAVGMRLTAPRLAHQREGSERYTVNVILAEERRVFDLVDATETRAMAWVRPEHTAAALGLSDQQYEVVTAIASTPQLVVPLSAPAGAGKTTSMRALRTIVERRHTARVIVIAPTGKAVDVAVAEGAATEGYTLHSALARLADGRLQLGPFDVVVVDEAGMVGTDHWRQLLTATTSAGTKTVMVGDAHQLEPVKARGGMFAQLCDELPWAQRLWQVWRQRDPAERAASLAVRDGGPAPVRRAVDWYRDHDRLACGDQVTMAADALTAHQGDLAAGKDALLLADTVEMCDALNRRVHDDTVAERTAGGQDVATVTGDRGHQIGVGDVVITRRNDPTIEVYQPQDRTQKLSGAPVRNGQRWRVVKVDDSLEQPRIAARRLGDGAWAVFDRDYLREHVQLGHAVTVHAAQGVTAERTHAVLADTASRNLAYVALTRGRASNHAYLYQRDSAEAGHTHSHNLAGAKGVHLARRGTPTQAARALRQVIGRDEPPRTAHQIAADTPAQFLPELVAALVAEHQHTVIRRRSTYQKTQRAQRDRALDRHLGLDRNRSQEQDSGYDLSL